MSKGHLSFVSCTTEYTYEWLCTAFEYEYDFFQYVLVGDD